MYEEIVKLDSKGRVTIPASLRLLLGLEEGSRLLLIADPDNLRIEIRVVPQDVTIEKIVVKENELAEIVSRYANTMYALSCYRRSDDTFQCRVVISITRQNIIKEVENNSPLNDKTRTFHHSWSNYNT